MSKKVKSRTRLKHNLEAYTFVAPFVIGMFAFFIYPLGFALTISFGKLEIVKSGNAFTFLGFQNYIDAFVKDAEYSRVFASSIADTVINTPLIVLFSLVLAVILNKKIGGQGIFRTMYFIPFLLGTGYVMKQLLGVGAVDAALGMARSIILPDFVWVYLGEKNTMVLYEFLNRITWILWRSGVQMVLFLSGLQSINPALYESAQVDSATEWEIFWKITFPMISPVLLLVTVYTIIDSYIDPTNPIVDLFLKRAFYQSQYSAGAAMSFIYLAVMMAFIGLVFLVMKKYIQSEFDK